jgi:thiol peroxidase
MSTITLHGNEINTVGELPKVGTVLQDFNLINQELAVKSLNDYLGKKKVFNIFPSIDTGVCAASARKFNEEATKMDNTVVINISRDLPFALGRFCAAEGLKNIENLSDFRSNFGEENGLTIANSPLQGLLSRAVIDLDEKNQIIYTEQVPEIAQEPNYDAVIEVLKS